MRRLYPREKHQLVFGAFVAAVAVVVALFSLILYLPARAEYRAVGETIARLESETELRREALERLESTVSGFDEARTQWGTLLGARLIPREQGFAAMIPDLERLAQLAGVRREQVAYNLIEEPQFGLYAVVINMPLRNSYESLTGFMQALEDADTFFILDAIQLQRADEDDDTDLDLSLNLTTFFREQP